MIDTENLQARLDRLQKTALVAGGFILAVAAVLGFLNPHQFFRSWLLGFLPWLGIAAGSLAVLALHHLAGGDWGVLIQRILEASSRTLPFLALLFLPLLFGLGNLYEWSHSDVVAADEILRHKATYLNVPFFVARALIYFAVWSGLAWLMSRWSAAYDGTGDPAYARKMQALAGPVIVIYVLTMTFAAVDWVMSLEPHWFSTIFGLLLVVGQVLGCLAFSILVISRVSQYQPVARFASPRLFHDLGNLLFAFVMLWAYISFSQYLIIWAGNLPEENPWYLRRTHGFYGAVIIFLIAFHFAFPFMLLLIRDLKRNISKLWKLAALVLLIRVVDLFWVIGPAHDAHGFPVHLLDILAPVGIGAVWLALFVRQFKSRPLLPVYHPTGEVMAERAPEVAH